MNEISEPMTPEEEERLLEMWSGSVAVRKFMPPGFPTIVTLCGSTRFKDHYEQANADEADAGKIVLSVSRFVHRDGLEMSSDMKKRLDELHLRKIDLSDEILVINPEVIVCGLCGKPTRLYTELADDTECCRSRIYRKEKYVGESTRNEIAYAERTGKKVRYRF